MRTFARTFVRNEPTSLTLTSDCSRAEHSSFNNASIACQQPSEKEIEKEVRQWSREL